MAYRLIGDPHEAEDLVQETFRSAWKSRFRYEPGRGDRAWLVSILRRPRRGSVAQAASAHPDGHGVLAGNRRRGGRSVCR